MKNDREPSREPGANREFRRAAESPGKPRLLPEYEPPEEETSASSRLRLEAHLKDVIAEAEAELARLGRPPTVWEEVNAHLTDVLPFFGEGLLTDNLLGPSAPRGARGPIASREYSSFTDMKREVKQCPQCNAGLAGVTAWRLDSEIVQRARRHHRGLFRRYQRERRKPPPPVFHEMPVRAAAYRAATAHAALQSLDSPMALFAAGGFLGRQGVIEYLLRSLPVRERKIVAERIALHDREWRELSGRKKKGKKSASTRLVEAVVQQLIDCGERVDVAFVEELLTERLPLLPVLRDHENRAALSKAQAWLDSNFESLKDKMGDRVHLHDDPPLVEIERDRAFFCFIHPIQKGISLNRLRRIIREAVAAKS